MRNSWEEEQEYVRGCINKTGIFIEDFKIVIEAIDKGSKVVVAHLPSNLTREFMIAGTAKDRDDWYGCVERVKAEIRELAKDEE